MRAVTFQQPQDTYDVLAKMNIENQTAEQGISGIRKILHQHPSLIVTEVEMQSRDGINLVKILQLLRVQIAVVFTSKTEKYRKRASQFSAMIGFLLHSEIFYGWKI